MKITIAALVLLISFLQYKLWFQEGGILETSHLRGVIATHLLENRALLDRNLSLAAEVKDLKSGYDAIEERARHELGLIKQGETFYQIVHE